MSEKDFIEEMQEEAKLRFGREITAEECAKRFAGHDLDARVYHLKNLSMDGDLTPKEAAKRYEYTSALMNIHEALRKADR